MNLDSKEKADKAVGRHPTGRESDDKIDTRYPRIVIPYFSGDDGTRPLPKEVIFFAGPAIKIQGLNYVISTPGVYRPDESLSITVDVDNRGVPSANVQVEVFWVSPQPASPILNKPLLLISRGRTLQFRANEQSSNDLDAKAKRDSITLLFASEGNSIF